MTVVHKPRLADSGALFTEIATEEQLLRQPSSAGSFPLVVKANIAVAGFRLSAGSPVLSRVATVDAPVVAAFRNAGAIVTSIANMHELAYGVTTTNAAFGNVEIPTHPGRSSGGSSGGSAAAVAGGFADYALGTDTGGSVSLPAALCGVVGFRPSTGRWPTAGTIGLSWTRDSTGVFTRTVAQARRADAWVTQQNAPDGGGQGIRLGVPKQLLENLSPAVEEAFRAVVERVAATYELVEIDYGGVLALTRAAETPAVRWESRQLLAEAAANALRLDPDAAFRQLVQGTASPDVRALLEAELASPLHPDEYARGLADTLNARISYQQLLAAHGIDALVFPTSPATAPPLGVGETVEHLGGTANTFSLYTSHTGQGTIIGAPMLTIPAAVANSELPVGVTIQGRRYEDVTLLALGEQLMSLISEK